MLTCQPIRSHLHYFAKPLTYTEDYQTQHAQPNHCLISDFYLLYLHHHFNMHMAQDCRQSPLKALLNTFGMHHKTYTVTTRYRIPDTEDIPATLDSSALDLVPPEDIKPKGGNESSDKHCEETLTCCHLAELLEQF